MKRKFLTWVSWITFLVSAISEWGLDADLPLTPALWLVMAAVVFFATKAPAALTTNSWTSSLPGNWHDPFSWSAGVPSNNQALVRIANSGSKVVLISAATATVPGTMTISNLILSAPSDATNTLALTDPGTNVPLHILNSFTITSGGALTISNGAVQLDKVSSLVTNSVTDDGEILLNSPNARLVNTNGYFYVGDSAVGNLTVSNGTWQAYVAYFGKNAGSHGTLTVAGGTNSVAVEIILGAAVHSTGVVWQTGGLLAVTNAFTQIRIGEQGVGQMTVSNGTWRASEADVGYFIGSQGTLTVAGGTNVLLDSLIVGIDTGAKGTVWVTGGQLTMNGAATLGYLGVGRMTMSNGTWLANSVYVGDSVGSQGSLTMAGGTAVISSRLIVGSFDCTATGIVSVTGGELRVTNDTGTAMLEVRSGTLTQSGGVLDIDRLIITNACGRFIRTGGTLITGLITLDPALDADGDGLPNGFEQTFGLDPLDPSGNNGPAGDPDGDGFTNLQEFQAGTDPTNSASAFRITAIARVANTNILVTWTMGPGKTNALQRTAGQPDGSYSTNNFATIFTITNTVGTVTNYLDVGAVTNSPARYYRVRLVP